MTPPTPGHDRFSTRRDEQMQRAYELAQQRKQTTMMNLPGLPAKQDLWMKTLSLMEQEVGEGRATDPEEIKRILAIEGLPYQNPDGSFVPFCAATIAKCAAKALAVLTHTVFDSGNAVSVFKQMLPVLRANYYNPSASVAEVVADAQRRGIWLDVRAIGEDTEILPGWLIAYSWPDGGHHIGMVRNDTGDTLSTVEGNVCTAGHPEGGMIAYKERGWGSVWGFIVTWKQ
jgi:hypothetical protein